MLEIRLIEDKIRHLGWVQIVQDSDVGLRSLKFTVYTVVFQWGMPFLPRTYFLIYENILHCNLWVDATGTLWVGARDAAKHPTRHRIVPYPQ